MHTGKYVEYALGVRVKEEIIVTSDKYSTLRKLVDEYRAQHDFDVRRHLARHIPLGIDKDGKPHELEEIVKRVKNS